MGSDCISSWSLLIFLLQSRKEHHRTNIQSQDPRREIPAASAESLPCLQWLQEGLWQGMVRSLMDNYEEIQHQRQHHTSHWKSVWQGPKCSPVQRQHRRIVQNHSRSSTKVCLLSPTLFNISLERNICEALDDHEGIVSIGGRLITNFRFADDIVFNAEEEDDAGVLVDRLGLLGSWMTTCLGKSCSFGLPRVPFVNCCQFMYLVISLLVLRAGFGIWFYQFLITAYLFTSMQPPQGTKWRSAQTRQKWWQTTQMASKARSR